MHYSLQTIDQLKPLIQGFRKQAGLTQSAMAEMLGITQQSYAQVEANLHATSVERLYMILRLLNVELTFSALDSETSGTVVALPGADSTRRTEVRSATDPAKPSKNLRQEAVKQVKETSPRKAGSPRPISPVAVQQSDKTKW